jgi:hypothetical protein
MIYSLFRKHSVAGSLEPAAHPNAESENKMSNVHGHKEEMLESEVVCSLTKERADAMWLTIPSDLKLCLERTVSPLNQLL